VCIRCHYRSTELLWQCPHCHEWNTFVEERIAAAKGHDETGGSDRRRHPEAARMRPPGNDRRARVTAAGARRAP
jgi:DNA repair protein RadA/Sms